MCTKFCIDTYVFEKIKFSEAAQSIEVSKPVAAAEFLVVVLVTANSRLARTT